MAKRTVKSVLEDYHKKVPFPWTLAKIKKAGFDHKKLFLELGEKLSQCSDVHTKTGESVLKAVNTLRQDTSP